MKCKDCGAHLPYGAYGHIRCEFCNAPNYVPIPGEKPEAAGKIEVKKEDVKREIQEASEKESSSKGVLKKLVVSFLILIAVLTVIGLFTNNSNGNNNKIYTSTPKPTYYTPKTTRPPKTTTPPTTTPPPIIAYDAIDLVPVSIRGYTTEDREKNTMEESDLEVFEKCRGTTAAASYMKNNDLGGMVIVVECDSEADAKNDAANLVRYFEENESVRFIGDSTLDNNINARWGVDKTDETGVVFIWHQDNFVIALAGINSEGGDPYDVGWDIANNINPQSPTTTSIPITTSPPITTTPPPTTSSPTKTPTPTMVDLMDDDPSKGPENAPVTIVEFSDFQCPYCASASSTVHQIIDTYGDKVRVVYRDFPLAFHANAQKAAEAAECADDQGMFWEYHDILYANQNTLGVGNLEQYAKDLGLDSKKFDDCLVSAKYGPEVRKDYQDGIAAGVRATPTFFINDEKLEGAQPFSAFQKVIDSML